MGVLLAVVMVLSFVEHSLPPIPLLPPGVKPGLSNIITMYCVFFLRFRDAYALAVAKSAFIALIRGPLAGLLSLSGGLLSVTVLVLLVFVFREKISYTAASICGAISHNLGQLAVAAVLTGTGMTLYYFPVLLVSGVIFGTVTGVTLSILLPIFNKIFKKR
jgi:heptaprenyl diphosphate synthase